MLNNSLKQPMDQTLPAACICKYSFIGPELRLFMNGLSMAAFTP